MRLPLQSTLIFNLLRAMDKFLHTLRSGRPALALDLMEEFRVFWGDRLVSAMINRKQLKEKHFEKQISGATLLTEKGRKIVIHEYQKRKSQEIKHSFLQEKTIVGLLPMLQSRLLARHLRGDLDGYPPCLFN